MITVIDRKSFTARNVAIGSDQVIAHMPIPPGGVFLGFRADIHAIAAVHQVVLAASSVNVKGVIVSMGGNMMDTGISVDTLFDQMVPKDADLSVVAGEDDIDWDDGAIATPFEEPGQVNWSDMVELGDRPTKVFETDRLVSLASGGRMPHVDTTDEYYPTVRIGAGSNKKVRSKKAAYFLLAVGSPSWDETATATPTTEADADWSALTYPDVMFDIMLPDILGLTETGAESPFSDMAQRAANFVEPVIHESATDKFLAIAWEIRAKWSVRIATPGRPQMKTLSGGSV